MLQQGGSSQLDHLSESLVHCGFYNASSISMKELERVHRVNTWQIAGVALVSTPTKQESILPLRLINLHQGPSVL